jgi:DNA-binding transcriptional MerR regulator
MQDDHVSTDVTSNVIWIDDEAAAQASERHSASTTDQAEFTIGELSREFGMTLRALRFYENKGLITPRREGSTRIYSRTDRSRLGLIRTGKKLGFTLAEIRAMLAGPDGRPDPETLRLSKEKCLEQIRLLEKQQLSLKAALAELWRIHAGLSAEIVRDGNQPDSAMPQRAG